MSPVLCLLLAIASPQDHDLFGYMKGKPLFSGTVTVKGGVVPTGIVPPSGAYYVMRIEGTVGTPGGRQADGCYRFVDPYDDELPKPGGPLSIVYGTENLNRGVPFVKERPKYRGDHVYEFLIQAEREGELKLNAPESYHDYPQDKPKDYYSGSVNVSIYEALPDDGQRTTLDLLDPQRFVDPNSADTLKLPNESPLRPGVTAKMADLPKVTLNGVAADGTSLVLVRLTTSSAGRVTFKLGRADGALYPMVGNPFRSAGKDQVATEAAAHPNPDKKSFCAFALYRPPAFFRNLKNPTVKIGYEFKPSEVGKGAKTGETSLAIVRPPVVLVHGTYDTPVLCYQTRTDKDQAATTLFERITLEGVPVVMAVDWEDTNGNENPSNFKDNMYTVWKNKDGIKDALEKMRSKGFVSTQADVVCHSQGGVITRVYARGFHLRDKVPPVHYTDPWKCIDAGCHYHGWRNYGMGDIHRLATISSTHMGSDICRLFNAYEKYSVEGKSIAGAWLDLFRVGVHFAITGIFTGGFEDQIPGSDALKAIGPTPVPSHAIACVSTDANVEEHYGGEYLSKLKKIYAAAPTSTLVTILRDMGETKEADRLEYLANNVQGPPDRHYMSLLHTVRRAVFGGDENDCTVRKESSFGGLAEPFRTRVEGLVHGYAPRYVAIQQRVLDLLRDNGGLFDVNGFPDAYAGTKATANSAIAFLDWSSESRAEEKPYPGWNELPKTDFTKPPGETTPPGTISVGPTVPTEIQGPWNDALQLYRGGDPQGAAKAFSPAVEALPKNAMVHSQYATYLSFARRFEESEAQMKTAVDLEPANPLYRVGYGNALIVRGKVQEAKTQYAEAVRLNPKLPEAHIGIGQLAIAEGRYADAEHEFREAVRLAPGTALFQSFVGNSLAFQNKWEEAAKFYAEAVRLDPNDSQGQGGMGSVMAMRGRFSEAEQYLRTAVRLDPYQGMHHANLAVALLKQGKKDEALKEAKTAQGLGVAKHAVFVELGIGG